MSAWEAIEPGTRTLGELCTIAEVAKSPGSDGSKTRLSPPLARDEAVACSASVQRAAREALDRFGPVGSASA